MLDHNFWTRNSSRSYSKFFFCDF